ncbi:hypothetical protein DEO72_LG9g1224 [Vigna unguiculata]|uniref:Uncharacterized protein n=1 Tax=Vigna unguiculata TaxID=3917 RepID=A0A4D6MXQ3_VIGUN|nr:hypothetical protein DEO72_LG9g1224 [Vigna unguiculata]
MASPKRDIAIMCEALFAFVAQASWRWVFGQEMISHRRDNMARDAGSHVWVLVRLSRLGDLVSVLSELSLAQARGARLSEIAT